MSWPIGKTYDGGTFTVSTRDTLAYARATDDPNPRYEGAEAVAPPMFHVRPFIPLMMQMARDPELSIDMLRLVHGEHGMRFDGLLRDGDALRLSGSLLDVSEKASGTIYTFALHGDVAGKRVLDGTTSYFVRAATPPPKGEKKAEPAPEPPAPTWSASQPVTADQALRYAPASGDDNPIHTDPEVAKKAGLPGCILHGLCSLAFAQRDLIAKAAGGDPARLAALSTRFTGMVFPGETLRMDVWGEGPELAFTTVNAKGRPVLVGKAEVRP
ncbi:MAG: MaoC family dehydratase N-terminal domain-containing protein [Alphaproteobacteria bacterium]|nr:MaoC family dehydratase N-terminal domain-containing protein [Alphaproteobacteria bacterium]